jgi:hypothetical protein
LIRFDVKRRSVVLEYEPELESASWVSSKLKTYHEVTISRTFIFKQSDLISEAVETPDEQTGEPVFRFRFATRADGYFRIAGRRLGISNDVLIADQAFSYSGSSLSPNATSGYFDALPS